MKKIIAVLLFAFVGLGYVHAQISITEDKIIEYSNPQEYEIGGITISGIKYLDIDVLKLFSGLSVGEKIMIPGDKITKAIQSYWKQGLFSDVKITATRIQGNLIFLDFYLVERPRLSRYSFSGVKKSEAEKLREEIKLTKGDVVTDNLILRTKTSINDYFIAKGFFNIKVDIIQKPDTAALNSQTLLIQVTKNEKVKIQEILFAGNTQIPENKLRRAMKETKQKTWYNIFKTSKFLENDYKSDKSKILDKYNALGYRDARITSDSVYKITDKTIGIKINITEGKKFYFRNISFIGNTKHNDKELNAILGIKKGDVFNQEMLDSRLYMSKDNRDIYSLYMDDGYLFFSASPVETRVENDSIDMEIRIYEGKQATINKVTVVGNVKTHDRVILREIRTKPGQLFNRSDIIRSQRELAQLRYFNPEKLNVNPKPNAADGTVDIEYVVEETSSDQIELSGGWGAGRIVGTLGLSFNNFSARNFFKGNAWAPVPSGDGQILSLRAQSSGWGYSSISGSFTEPWFGGKKPNALSTTIYRTIQSNASFLTSGQEKQAIYITGVTVGLGKRLLWPDDYFTLYYDISYQNYDLHNYNILSFNNGTSNNLSLGLNFGRNSIDQPTYPRGGSSFGIRLQATPPYSFLNKKDYTKMTTAEKFKWVEFYKWKVNTSWFASLAGNLVFSSRLQMGFLGYYNKTVGTSPFGRYWVGGDGLTGYNVEDREIVAMRGYSNNSITPWVNGSQVGGAVYNRFTLELRYPISLNPMSTIYVLGFAEGGNAWLKFTDVDPFKIKRSAGVGVRIMLPMFGMLGLDWGYGFDNIPGPAGTNKSQFHFSINQSID